MSSTIIDALRSDLQTLSECGAIGKQTLRDLDAISPRPVRELSPADIRKLREALNVSQPVFALHLHTTASTIRKWEHGQTRPAGPALKLLNMLADKGLQVLL